VILLNTVAEVGSEVGGGGVRLPGLLPRHCVIAHTEGVVTGQYSKIFPHRRLDLVFFMTGVSILLT
jgi:hypothetical protein